MNRPPRPARATRRALACWIFAGAATLLAACGGGGGESAATPPAGGAAGADEKLVAADAAALTEHFRARLAAGTSVAPGGVAWGFVPARATTVNPLATAAGPESAGGDASASPVLQEAGVDEDDVVRTADGLVYALTPPDPRGASPQRLLIQRAVAGGAAAAPLAVVALEQSVRYSGLLHDPTGRRIIVTGVASSAEVMPLPTTAALTVRQALETSTVVFIDVADPARAARVATLSFDGTIQVTRVVDARLWLVLRNPPRFDGFDWSGTPAATEANRSWLARFTPADTLPGWRLDGRAQGPLVAADGCWLQPAAPGGMAALTTIASIALAAPTAAPVARCVAAPVETVYMTPDALYLATTRYARAASEPVGGPVTVAPLVAANPATDLHKFALRGAALDYRGSGSVPGRLSWGADTARFMLSARGGDLRVVTQADPWTPAIPASSPARLSVLRDDGAGALRTLASLPNARRPAPIGKPGEQVHAVRFVGERAYVVTFRRTDPVYAIDLGDPADPRLLGALEVPGFSDRLVPLTPTLLLGVGHATRTVNGADVRAGVLVSLIDVTDPAQPRELARRTLGGSGSTSASDYSPHGVSAVRVGERFRIALPVSEHGVDPPTTGGPALWQPLARLAAHRFEVDPAAPVLAAREPVVFPDPRIAGGTRRADALPFDRALQVGDDTWLWADGHFVGAAW